MRSFIVTCSIFMLLLSENSRAQQNNISFAIDTVILDINQAEQQFVNKSLILLAAKYDVDISKANVLQVKQWYNPNITYSQQLYDATSGKYLDYSSETGQVDVQVNQMISIAGKHINAVKLAKLDVEKSQYSFDELALSLKYELYSNFSDLIMAQQKLKLYKYEDENLSLLITAAKQEVALGALAGNELVRLEAELQNLRNDALNVESNLIDAQAKLKQLLHFNYKVFIVAKENPPSTTELIQFDKILALAQQNRPDLLLANTDIKYQSQNLKLQRSNAIPDLNLGVEYDRRSSYTLNYYGISAGMDLPFFNRNQGQIKMARLELEQAQWKDSLENSQVENEVVNSYTTLLKIRNRLLTIDPGYTKSIDDLATNAIANYQKKYISLLEFLDQLRTYQDARFGIIDLNSDYFKAIQYLNFTVGSTVLK